MSAKGHHGIERNAKDFRGVSEGEKGVVDEDGRVEFVLFGPGMKRLMLRFSGEKWRLWLAKSVRVHR